MTNKLLTCLLFLCTTFSLHAQGVMSPSEFLGYELGSKFTRHHQVVDYFKHVASAYKSQVKLEQYGTTNERRPLYLAYVSSAENIANLDQIRQNNLAIVNSGKDNTSGAKTAIVWLSYNVHGNESSSTEASMLTIYKLLTEKQDWLANTLVIMDPCINPDGRDRYVNWYNETASVPYNTDQQASEHNEPWPGGRANHYLFDLNRDWVWVTQIETQNRLRVYNQWMPQIHVDFHEQGINEPYYFAPAAEPYHEIITNWQREFQDVIGKNHAKYFDAEGWLFFTKERFDLLYPSYGDTYPTYMGAIGMTYEQAGNGSAGLGILNDEGVVLTLKDRLLHHTVTGLSTVEISSKNAERLLDEFSKFFSNNSATYKSYVLQGNQDKINRLKQLLDKHEITYGNATASKATGYDYNTGKTKSKSLSNDALVVSTDQPKGKMVKVLFEPNTFLRDSLTYDITAWSLPYAYGLDAIASKSIIPSALLMQKQPLPSLVDAYGYVSKWNSMEDAQFLADLLKNNIRVRFTEKNFKSNGTDFNRGSIIITKGDNKQHKDFIKTLNDISQKHHQSLTPINSGYSDKHPDIGSPDIKLVNPAKIAVLSGSATSSLSFGEVWHFFEQQLQFPITVINSDDFLNINLNKYHVLIMPSGYYGEMLNENAMSNLKEWIRNGGKVIAIDRALRSFANSDGFSLKTKESNSDSDSNNLTPYAERERQYTNQLITGAIFKTEVDNTHPMAFGYDKNYFTLKLGSSSYALLDRGYNVAYLEDTTVYSGFAGKKAINNLDDTLVFGEERIGSGSIVYLVDNPLFRGFWDNGKLFFVNALFFVNNNAFEM
ncbi:MAG: zinc carboxypeptidase [Winogradskyella sp.]|nr:zinc carboxypeptidase [Winogradskyella sp.]